MEGKWMCGLKPGEGAAQLVPEAVRRAAPQSTLRSWEVSALLNMVLAVVCA